MQVVLRCYSNLKTMLGNKTVHQSKAFSPGGAFAQKRFLYVANISQVHETSQGLFKNWVKY